MDTSCYTETPFIINVNLDVNSPNNQLYSVLIDPKKQKTIIDVIKKLKLLFGLTTKINLITAGSSILPEKETVEILYYVKLIWVQICDNSFLYPKSTSQVEEEVIQECITQSTRLAGADTSGMIDVNVSENKEAVENKFRNGSGKYTKSFSVGSFLANLRENVEEPNIPVNVDNNISLTSAEQEDCPRKRKRTRRRKKKDVSFEEYESEVSSSKYMKPYSFEKTHEEAKHMRFNDNENHVNNDTTLSDDENLEKSIESQVYVENEFQPSTLNTLLSLKSPVVYVRTQTTSEKE